MQWVIVKKEEYNPVFLCIFLCDLVVIFYHREKEVTKIHREPAQMGFNNFYR